MVEGDYIYMLSSELHMCAVPPIYPTHVHAHRMFKVVENSQCQPLASTCARGMDPGICQEASEVLRKLEWDKPVTPVLRKLRWAILESKPTLGNIKTLLLVQKTLMVF